MEIVRNNPSVLAKDTGKVEVLGMLRASQERNSFTPDNLPEKGQWYWADVDAMAQYAGGADVGVQPVYIDAVFGPYGVFIEVSASN